MKKVYIFNTLQRYQAAEDKVNAFYGFGDGKSANRFSEPSEVMINGVKKWKMPEPEDKIQFDYDDHLEYNPEWEQYKQEGEL